MSLPCGRLERFDMHSYFLIISSEVFQSVNEDGVVFYFILFYFVLFLFLLCLVYFELCKRGVQFEPVIRLFFFGG